MSSDITKTSHPEIFLFKAGFVAVFILLLALTVIVRIRTLATPLERDVGEYAYAGQLILEGVPPFQNTYKIPAIYYAYAVILACFGQSPSGINTAALLINTATIILLFFLAKRLFGTVAGAASAVFFAITSISNTVKATANAEIFVVLFAIAGIILLMNFAGSKKYLSLVTGAVLLGIGFTMKQHGAGFILFGFLFLLWNQVRQKPFNWKNLVFVILVYCFSAIAPFLIICLVLWHYGVLGKFWFWAFTYASCYVKMMPLETGFALFKMISTDIISSAPFVWLTALIGLLSIIWNGRIRKHGVFLIGFLVCSFAAVCPGLYFRPHYFVLFLPAVAISAGAGINAIGDIFGLGIKSTVKTAFISALVILAVWLQSAYCQRNYLLESDPVNVSRYNFGFMPFPEAVEIAKYIKNNSGPDDKIAVLGSEPEIYFYSHRRSASAYIYVYSIVEPQPYAADMQREMISQIEAAKPKFIVDVKCYNSWLLMPDSEKLIFEWMREYLPIHYRQVGLVEIFFPAGQTVYTWTSTAEPLKKEGYLLIYKRID